MAVGPCQMLNIVNSLHLYSFESDPRDFLISLVDHEVSMYASVCTRNRFGT